MCTPLFLATKHNASIDVLQFLLEAGANVDGKDSKHNPIRVAINKRRLDAVNLFLMYGANLEKNCNKTMLEAACSAGHLEIFKALLSKVERNENKYGTSCIFYAIEYPKILRILLEERVLDIDKIYMAGTALWHASYRGNVESVKILIEFGADVNKGLYTYPLSTAIWANNKEIVEILLDAGANTSDPKENLLGSAIAYGPDTVPVLLSRGTADWTLENVEKLKREMGTGTCR